MNYPFPHLVAIKLYLASCNKCVPEICELCFQQLFHTPGLGFSSDVIYVIVDELSVATMLNETVAQFPAVSFGSYPKMFHRYVIIVLTLSSGS